ncbi:hypothetical protein BS47DRAFT_1482628 [Hydnum rufescens UP504]|uniref:FHA domain-containing protein n=1 Tax=Hydnum rufescens UP504 TaxID=1448309 RepID=A0A9P6B6W9_9AGAM|nr:hypothetical protein BS47DRAFT_1482628 [Hydnum rufescens UP504]
MQNEGVSLVSAYFAIRFPAFTYYVKTLSCTIGRRSAPGNRDDLVPVHVDIDLGPLKSVSRLHARIEFDEDRDGFVICVLGRNGAWVGGDWVKSGAKVLLGPKTTIQIASRSFQFLVAPAPAAPPASTSVASTRGTEAESSSRTKNKNAAPLSVDDLDARIQLALQKQILAQSPSSTPSAGTDIAGNATSAVKVRLPIRVAAIATSDIAPVTSSLKPSHRPSTGVKQPPIVFKNGELILNERIFGHLTTNQLKELGKLDPTDVSELLQVEVRRFYKEEMRAQKLQQAPSSQGRIATGKGISKLATTRRPHSSGILSVEGAGHPAPQTGAPPGSTTNKEAHVYRGQPPLAPSQPYPSNTMPSPLTAPHPMSSSHGHGNTQVYHPLSYVGHYTPQHYYSPYPAYSFPPHYQSQPFPHPLPHSHQPHHLQASVYSQQPYSRSEPPPSDFDVIGEGRLRGPPSFRSDAAPPDKHASHEDLSDQDEGKR